MSKKRRLVSIVAWTLAVVAADVYFGGGQVAHELPQDPAALPDGADTGGSATEP